MIASPVWEVKTLCCHDDTSTNEALFPEIMIMEENNENRGIIKLLSV